MTRPRARTARLRGKELESEVAFALLHLDDVAALADSPLTDLPLVRARWEESRMLFREGIGLADALEAVVRSLIPRLPEGRAAGKVAFVRATLEGVVIKRESVSAVARAHARSREHWARTYWPQAVALVASELSLRDGEHERGHMTLEAGRAKPDGRTHPGTNAASAAERQQGSCT